MDSRVRSFPKRPEGRRPRPCGPVPCLLISGRGFPHSDIRGSKLVRSSPRLFAAYHVLHRLRVPRHPPNALKALDRSHCRCPPIRKLALRERMDGTASARPQTDGTDFDPNDAAKTAPRIGKTSVTTREPYGDRRPRTKMAQTPTGEPARGTRPQRANPRTSG
jgi:hypothetical protein